MRILLLADIHANWAALEAIDEPYDRCVVLGDLVDYGPEPAACVQWAQQNAHWCIRGNHDHAVAQNILSRGTTGYPLLTSATRPLMWKLLTPQHISYLGRLPVTETLTWDGRVVLLVHATPRDPLDEFLLNDPEQWRRRLGNTDADLVCVGHTHFQFELMAGDIQVVNPGSVGQPRDGDPRAAYAIIENGKVELKRVEYDVERTIAALVETDIPDAAKELAAHVLRTGGARTRSEL